MLQYVVTVVLNNKKIGKNPEILTKIKPSINKYKLKEVSSIRSSISPIKKNDWKNFWKNNITIALNVLYVKK